MSLGEAVIGLRRICQNRYGHNVMIRLVEPTSPEARENHKIAHLLFKHRKSLPVVTLNDDVICTGELPKGSIYSKLDQLVEVRKSQRRFWR